MSLRCLLIVLGLFVVCKSSVISRRHIPVEIIYDRSSIAHYGTRNLAEKIQLNGDEVLKISKNIPNVAEVQTSTSTETSNEISPPKSVEDNVKSILSPNDDLQQTLQNQEVAHPNLKALRKRLESVIYEGINNIRKNIDESPGGEGIKPGVQIWKDLNQTVAQFLDDQLKKIDLKQAPPNNQNQGQEFWSNFVNGISNIGNNFVQSIQNGVNAQRPNGTEDEGTGNQPPWQGIQNFISNGDYFHKILTHFLAFFFCRFQSNYKCVNWSRRSSR